MGSFLIAQPLAIIVWRFLVTAAIISVLSFGAAAAANPDHRERVAPNYQRLQSLSRDYGTVRVIARVSVTSQRAGRQARTASALGNLRTAMAQINVSPVKEFKRLSLAVYSLTEAQLDDLIDSGLVEAVYEDRLNKAHLVQSLPLIGGDVAHNFGLDGNDATVAIIDTGVDASHTVFGSRVVEEACFSSKYAPYGGTSLCPSGGTRRGNCSTVWDAARRLRCRPKLFVAPGRRHCPSCIH
jgi:subtilisin family serine protease